MNRPPADTLALVTGASRRQGLGFEVSRQLARWGFKVILTARDGAAAKDRAGALSAEGFDVIGRALDVTSSESISALASEVSSVFGKLDALVNNAAGIGPYGETAADADLRVAQSILDVTLLGAWRMCQAFLPLLRKSPHPRIVNVSSGAGSHGDSAFGLTTDNNMGTSYAVAKAALNALTVKFAKEELSAGVLVNAVCPGFTATFEGGAAMGARPVSDGAESIVWAALIEDGGPTGGFFRDGKPLPW